MWINMFLYGVLPAMVVVVGTLWVVKSGQPEGAEARRLFFLLIAGLLINAAQLVIFHISRGSGILSLLFLPVSLIVFTLTVVNARAYPQVARGRSALAAALVAAQVVLIILLLIQPDGLWMYLLPGWAVLTLIWAASQNSRLIDRLALFALAAFLLAQQWISGGAIPTSPAWFPGAVRIFWISIPPLAISLAAALVYSVFRRADADESPQRLSRQILRLGLALGLIAAVGYLIYWSAIWDKTNDGLGGVFFLMFSAPISIAAGSLLMVKLSGLRRPAGLVFMIVVFTLLNSALSMGWQVSFPEVTEERAARVQKALERYHTRTGRYPDELTELVPRDLLFLQQPVMFQGESWCYQGGKDGYRLGAFHHEYFGMTVTLHVYAASGTPFATPWACEARLAEMRARHDWSLNAVAHQAATPVPPPASVVSIVKEPLPLLVRDPSISAGSWSPDGNFWLFSLRSTADGQPRTSLHFMRNDTGLICPVDVSFPASQALHNRNAWLADGRLLYLDADQSLFVLTPCAQGAENISRQYPTRFKEIYAAEAHSGRVLLGAEDSYYILDGHTLQAWPVSGVAPNPYEAHWDHSAWVPGGAQLAISHLNGRDARQGSTLYRVDAGSGALLTSLALRDASDQSAPMIKWLSDTELLLHGQGGISIYDFASDPPLVTAVIKDLFSLDLKYPDETASWSSLVNPEGGGYHLLLRAHHPRNKAIYHFDSRTHQLTTISPQADALLFLPGGQWTPLPKYPEEVPAQDELELYWLDSDFAAPVWLRIEGHLPRETLHLGIETLPETSRLVISSQQGVSLVSLPDGALLRFWELAGGTGYAPYAQAAPDEQSLIVIADGTGLYRIPLQ